MKKEFELANQRIFTEKGGYGPNVYDALIRTYSGWRGCLAFHVNAARKYLSSELKEGLFLDVGTGTGLMAEKMSKEFPNAEIWALDLSTDMLRYAVEKGRINVERTIQGSAANISTIVQDKKISFAFSHSVQWAMADPRLMATELAKVIVPSGIVSVSTVNKMSQDALAVFPSMVERDAKRALKNKKASIAKGLIPVEGVTKEQLIAFVDAQKKLSDSLTSPLSKDEFISIWENAGFRLLQYKPEYWIEMPNGDKIAAMHMGVFIKK